MSRPSGSVFDLFVYGNELTSRKLSWNSNTDPSRSGYCNRFCSSITAIRFTLG